MEYMKIVCRRGVKVSGIYYWAAAFQYPKHLGAQIPVEYDPFNMKAIHAFLNNHWVECHRGNN